MKPSSLIPAIPQPAVWQLYKEWRALDGGVHEFGLQSMLCQAASRLCASNPKLDPLDAMTQASMQATSLRNAAQGNRLFQEARVALEQTRDAQAQPGGEQAGSWSAQ